MMSSWITCKLARLREVERLVKAGQWIDPHNNAMDEANPTTGIRSANKKQWLDASESPTKTAEVFLLCPVLVVTTTK